MTLKYYSIHIYLMGTLAFMSCAGPGQMYLETSGNVHHDYDVTIYRDTWGVPHIFGKTDADAAYGLAWAHSEDDFKTIQEILIAGRAQLGSVYGPKASINDYYVHILGIWDQVNARYEEEIPNDVKALCEAYANGLNHYAGTHPEQQLLGLYPVRGKDIIAGFMHRLPLMYGLERTIGKLYRNTKPKIASIDGGNLDENPLNISMLASNVIAVAPERSDDGFTRLLLNTHQPWNGPTSWYEVHVHSEQGWNITGGLFPGSPVVFIGHGPNHGWSHTVNSPDLIDVYELEMNPANEDQYLFDGEWNDLIVESVPIRVKLWGPIKWTYDRKIYRSVHGPVLKRKHGVYAIRYSGMDEMRTLEQWYRMNKAKDLGEFKDAMSMLSLPMFNTGYADKEGNIYYLYNGMIPDRDDSFDWRGYLPGNTSKTLWTDYIDFESLPQVLNPPGGFYQNCNASPFLATGNENDVFPSEVPSSSGIETHQTNRSLRAIELYGKDTSITRDDFYRYKYDIQYSKESVMAYAVERFVSETRSDDKYIMEVVGLLKNWDLKADADSRAAALAIMIFPLTFKFDDYLHDHDVINERLQNAITNLRKYFGRVDVRLGDVQRLIRGDTDLPLAGGPGVLRAIYAPWNDGKMVASAGDCYFQIVEWDPEGNVSAESIHHFGTAIQDQDSPHYDDQSLLFSNQRMKPVWMNKDDILQNLEREYHPGK